MTAPGKRIRRLRLLAGLLRAARMVVLVLLALAAWATVVYVCGRQAQLIPPQAGAQLLRDWLPGIH